MTQRHCRVCRGWHDLSAPWPYECAGHFGERKKRSTDIPLPMLIRDQMDPLQHPADMKFYDSKAEFRAVAKAHNLIEVGTETQKDTRANDLVTRDEVGQAINMLNQGYRPELSTESAPLE